MSRDIAPIFADIDAFDPDKFVARLTPDARFRFANGDPVTGRAAASELGSASLAAELYAAEKGADFIRTHDPAALTDGLEVMAALRTQATRSTR